MSDNNIMTADAKQQQGGLTLVAAFLAATDTKKAGEDLASLLQEGNGTEIKQALELTASAGRRAAEILSASTSVLVGKELNEEFRKIDEETSAALAKELREVLDAISAEWQPKIVEEAQAKAMKRLQEAAKAFDEAAKVCIALGAMSSTMSAPSGDVIGVATSSVMSSGQAAPSTALTGVAAEVAAPSTAALGV